MKRRLMMGLILATLSLLLAAVPSHNAQAATYYFILTKFGIGYCDTNVFTVNFSQDYNLPVGTFYSRSESFNGGTPVVQFSNSPIFGSNYTPLGGTQNVVPFSTLSAYTYVVRYWFTGAYVGQSVITIKCSPPYSNTNGIATIVNTIGYIPSTAASLPLLSFTDGRCDQAADQPATIYPDNKGGYEFYAVNSGVGYFAMHVTKAQLDAHPKNGTTYLIAESMGVRLYRLADGGLQVNRLKPDGSDYTYNLANCGAA
jgi:hypothetical protein